MNEWFHCNKCFLVGTNDSQFWFTSCGHIICAECKKNGNLLLGQKGICVVCSKQETSIMMVNKNMKPDLIHLFRPPKDLLLEFTSKIKTTVEFQNAHRQRFFKHIREKYNKAAKIAKAAHMEITKRVEREKNLLAERNQVRMELDSTKDYVRQLEKVLADRDQEIHRLKRKSPSFVKRTSPHLKGRAGFPSLNGNTPLSRVSFFGCTTSTPNDFANIAAGCLDNRRRNNVGGNAGTAGEFDFLSQQRAMEEVVAGGPSFIPNTPALLGLPADTSNDNNDDQTNKDLDEEQPSPDLEANELTLFTDSSPMQFKVPENLPDVPIIAINRYPFFPGFIKKVDLKQNEALMNLIKSKARQKLPYVGLFVKKNPDDKSEAVPSISHLYTVGTFAHIFEMRDHEGRMLEMILNSHRRIRILQPLEPTIDFPKGNGRRKLSGNRKANLKTKKEEIQPEEQPQEQQIDQPPEEKLIIYARTENIVDNVPTQISIEITVKMQAIVSIIREIIRDNNMMAQHVALLLQPEHSIVDNPVYLCDFVGTIAQNAETEELQAVMEEINIMRRLDLALELLEKERARVKMLKSIRESVEKKVQEQNHKYLLNEQLKAIKRELGIEKEDKQAVLERLDERLANLNVPEYAMKVIKEEQTKLSFLDPHSSEFSISRNYLDWLTSIPWGKTSEEVTDVNRAQKILEEDHYGMKDIKERILEFIAVGILKKQTNGKILCFYGPPGVGKTSIAKSIARALNREYYRFSVGGMTDVAEIKGHRRTYIGAMPGKTIQCFKKVQAENPLILIDEIDKIGGAGYHGDPASALLEVLDPEQNSNFLDHFIDVPVDLSKVLFICTANETDRIPGPVKDRMEMIEVSGYVAEEKMEIAKNFLVPKCREKCALTEENLIITNEAINTLIRSYCRESGVRNLEKHLEKIFRKAAFRIVSNEENKNEKIIVDNSNLKEFVGREKFTSERLYDVTPPGVIMGLAWTAMGGSALYIEASLARKLRPWDAHQIVNTNVTTNSPSSPPQGSLEATGHLGDVMKESMRTAYTVAKNVLGRRDPNNEFLEQAHIHVHVPEGAVPKDGPSAGCTITSALLSLATGKPAVQGISMTGEISLTGKVLPVGGIKEKIIAAKRAGVNCVVLPEENKKDYEDLADFIKKDVEIHFVDHYDQVFDLIFPNFVPTTNSS